MTRRAPDRPAPHLPPYPGGGWPELAPGWVWLVGAGPGDPGLLTLHALNALAQADAVVHDALVDRRILAWARPEAEIIHAGKRGGKPSPTQADITERLIALARAGRRVLRLKGGDPFVFGRGGEEAAGLIAAGVPVRVVPGVTAGIAGAAAAGIPLTHRDVNQSVTFITGHDQSGEVPGRLDWAAISRASEVLVIYMGLKHLARICAALRAAGRPADEPVAVIADATLPGQKVVQTTLDRAPEAVAAAGVAPPAVIVVGGAVALRARLLPGLAPLTGR